MGNLMMAGFEWALPLAQQQAMPGAVEVFMAHLVAALVFSMLGIVIFFICLLVMEKLTHFSLVKAIGEDHNMAVALVVAAIVLGTSFIIAAAIQG